MSKFSPKYWQNCATCDFWVGPRTCDAQQGAAVVKELVEGKCTIIQADAKRFSLASCTKWKKWASLQPPASVAH